MLHELDFVSLRDVDTPGNVHQLRPVRALRDECGHLHGLVVVRNHVLDKLHVVLRIAIGGDLARFFDRDGLGRFTGCTRLNDRCVLGKARSRLQHKNYADGCAAKNLVLEINANFQWYRSCVVILDRRAPHKNQAII